jgi:CheY-like chemotaxis protein/anti-sigma regulatory factor (Ser/Thr protein kinase)
MPRILVVEDDRATQHLLLTVLTREGFDVTIARDGLDALERLRSSRFELVLLDIWMPRMTGLELLERLRTWDRTPRVIVMTSDDAPQTVLDAVRANAYRYVHKPVTPEQLVQTVRDALAASASPPIEIISARPEWVELLVPCTRDSAEQIHSAITQLDAQLPADVRDTIAYAFRELLLNAIEWGGRLDPERQVRIACLRTRRMVLYRIADPGPGFDLENLAHAAIGQPDDQPVGHMSVREAMGLRPGGFGLLTVRASVDELIYNEKRNEVVFVKYLG